MKAIIEIKKDTLIKAKGFDISIGITTDEVALISHSTGDFARFKDIRKGGRLSKIKRVFKHCLCSDTDFFFRFMTRDDIFKLINILK